MNTEYKNAKDFLLSMLLSNKEEDETMKHVKEKIRKQQKEYKKKGRRKCKTVS